VAEIPDWRGNHWPGKSYRVGEAGNLSGQWFPLQSGISATPPLNVIDIPLPWEMPCFFRVVVE